MRIGGLATLLGVAAMVWIGGGAGAISGTDTISFSCSNSTVTSTVGNLTTQVCSNGTGSHVYSCSTGAAFCTATLTDVTSVTHRFSNWTSTGDAYFLPSSTSSCVNSVSHFSTLNPVVLCFTVSLTHPSSGTVTAHVL